MTNKKSRERQKELVEGWRLTAELMEKKPTPPGMRIGALAYRQCAGDLERLLTLLGEGE